MASRNTYTKDLKLNIDTTDLQKLKNELALLQKEKLEIAAKELLTLDKMDPQNIMKVKELSNSIAQFTKEVDKMSPDKLSKEFKDGMKKLAKSVGLTIVDFVTEIFNDAIKRLEEMSSYDLANTRIFNREAYEQAMKYGITDPSQNYALTQAMKEFRLSSEEDIMMGAYDREAFAERIGYHTEKYQSLANRDFFRTIQDFTAEWENFKTDLEFSMIEFFMQNKELIKNVMVKGISFMEATLKALDSILTFLGHERTDYERQSALETIVTKYSAHSSTANNVTVNNNFNASSELLADKHSLDRALSSSLAQVIAQLNEGR